jgi:hypothetical protein
MTRKQIQALYRTILVDSFSPVDILLQFNKTYEFQPHRKVCNREYIELVLRNNIGFFSPDQEIIGIIDFITKYSI